MKTIIAIVITLPGYIFIYNFLAAHFVGLNSISLVEATVQLVIMAVAAFIVGFLIGALSALFS